MEAGAPDGGGARGEDEEPVRVVVEFEPGAELAGRVLPEGGGSTEFAGRLELYAALERARGAPPPLTPRSRS